jgi:hypothetical protein
VCSNPAKANGAACNDGNACTQTDVCQAGTCSGSPVNVNDGNPCTTDTCNPATGNISHLPIAGCGVTASFVIGDGDAVVGKKVTFWGAQWAKTNTLSGGSAPDAFKGYANTVTSNSQTCGGSWKSDPGNSSDAPSTVPATIQVIAASSISKTGAIISGNIRKVVTIKVDSGYAPNPGHAGTGTVMSVVCQ